MVQGGNEVYENMKMYEMEKAALVRCSEVQLGKNASMTRFREGSWSWSFQMFHQFLLSEAWARREELKRTLIG